jgi:hypothetical protein
MTVHQSRRVALALVTLLVTSITIGAPIPLAASPLHRPIANHVTHPDVRFDGRHRPIAPRSPAAQSRDHHDDPFAALHFE